MYIRYSNDHALNIYTIPLHHYNITLKIQPATFTFFWKKFHPSTFEKDAYIWNTLNKIEISQQYIFLPLDMACMHDNLI